MLPLHLMDTRKQILKFLKKRAGSGAELAKRLAVSRQAVNVHLKKLVLSGQVIKTGVTRGAAYALPEDRHGVPAPVLFSKTFSLSRLAEDAVFRDAAGRLQLSRAIPGNVRDIVQYGFTEMLNNAIEHSQAADCKIQMGLDPYVCFFSVRDPGIGLFHSIASNFGLPDENVAAGELLKGKATTMAERHSGEGIFFTSRVGDVVRFRSHRIEVIFSGQGQDVVVNERRFLRGTEVRFEISRHSRRKVETIFGEFAPAELDYRFEKTRVLVKLFRREFVSRSEARRMMAGLDKFRMVELDFRNVKSLGQGFADEVFRVYANAHPHIEIKAVNLSPALEPMLRHVIDNKNIGKIDNSLTIARGASRPGVAIESL